MPKTSSLNTSDIAKTDFNQATQNLITDFNGKQKVSANALILSVFGDSVSVHGGTIWLGSLINLVSQLNINERLVRTSVFRLTESGILQSKQQGRRSFYSFTDIGLRQFLSASERIYHYHDENWDGQWRMVFILKDLISNEQREGFKKELNWLGFSRLAPGVYGHPTANIDDVKSVAREMKIEQAVALMQAKSLDDVPMQMSTNLVKLCFDFENMAEHYQNFIDCFEPVLHLANNGPKTNDKDAKLCFLLRTILIHRFRGLLLREPELPRELVPNDCLSHRVREITEGLYKLISAQAEKHFARVGESVNGAMPELQQDYFNRFGGL